VLSIVIAEFESGSDNVKYLSNSLFLFADLLNTATLDAISYPWFMLGCGMHLSK